MKVRYTRNGCMHLISEETDVVDIEEDVADANFDVSTHLTETMKAINADEVSRGVKTITVDTYIEAYENGTVVPEELIEATLFEEGSVFEFLDNIREEVERKYLDDDETLENAMTLKQGCFIESINPEVLTDDQYDTRMKLCIASNRFQLREVPIA